MPENPPAYPEAIGHFRLTGFLGEGGMGVVYRAKDTQLNRNVALKLLSPAFAKDPQRLARFTREAQVLASLNHPGIGAVYGVENKALVLELVEGPTLAERIAQGPMPFPEALPLIGQLIDAIEYAHEKGVVYRDLKPANIKLTADGGQVKILDFGLAKALSVEVAGSPVNPSDSPTLTMRSTEAGLILGTAAYMAAVQARGKTVDKRADIWSFGVVVYELLTARRLFQGETVTDTLAQTLTKEVDWGVVPPEARRLLARCLERNPKLRLRDIGDARELLLGAPALAAKRSGWLWPAAGVALALFVGCAAAWWWASGQRSVTSYPVLRAPVGRLLPFASPDGKWLIGVTQEVNSPLQLRRLDTTEWRTLAGTEGSRLPFWSADSTAFGFFVSGQLRI